MSAFSVIISRPLPLKVTIPEFILFIANLQGIYITMAILHKIYSIIAYFEMLTIKCRAAGSGYCLREVQEVLLSKKFEEVLILIRMYMSFK